MNFDFLGLQDKCFRESRLLLLTGVSGSGKSTALKYLIEQHPSFLDQTVGQITGSPLDWRMLSDVEAAPVIAVDEIRGFVDALKIYYLVCRKKKVIVASHCPAWWFFPLKIMVKANFYRTDSSIEKLSKYLEQLSIKHSTSTLKQFTKIFGASYTDLDIILELHPSNSFDTSFAQYSKLSSISACDTPNQSNCGTRLLRASS